MAEIIEAYGLFWDASDVDWAKASASANLLGIPAWQKKADPINFAKQSGIYVLYDGHKIIYVGQVGSGKVKLYGRLRGHRHDSLAGRWDHFSWFGLRKVTGAGKLGNEKKIKAAQLTTILNQMEAILIAAAEPTLNKQGGRFGPQRRYKQKRDKILGPTECEMIQKIYGHLQELE